MTWERRMVDTARGWFEVFTRGSGQPLCVTHLYSEFNQTGDYFAEKFSQDRQVFLVNLREAGNSAKAHSDEELSMLQSVADLDAIRTALGITAWDFAGLSTGGMLGLVYAVTMETSLKSLILVGSAASREYNQTEECIYHPSHPQFSRMQDLIERLKEPDLSSQDRRTLTEERTKLSLYDPDKYHEYFPSTVTKRIAAKRLNYFARVDHSEFDVRHKLGAIKVPVLILCGRHDVQCPLRCSMEMNRLIGSSKLVVFEHSNHYPFLEESAAFSDEVDSFLRSFA